MPPAKKAPAGAKKSAAPAKPAAQPTITLKHLAAALADSHDIAKKQAEAVLGDLVTLTTRHLKKGAKIRLTGLGILQVRARPARMGRNPATGEAITLSAADPLNLVGILVPGERVPAISGRTVAFRDGVALQQAEPTASPLPIAASG